jgi:hypothetical protein
MVVFSKSMRISIYSTVIRLYLIYKYSLFNIWYESSQIPEKNPILLEAGVLLESKLNLYNRHNGQLDPNSKINAFYHLTLIDALQSYNL